MEADDDVTIDTEGSENPGGRTSPECPAAVVKLAVPTAHHCPMKSGVISHFGRVRLFGRPPKRSHRSQIPYARLPVCPSGHLPVRHRPAGSMQVCSFATCRCTRGLKFPLSIPLQSGGEKCPRIFTANLGRDEPDKKLCSRQCRPPEAWLESITQERSPSPL